MGALKWLAYDEYPHAGGTNNESDEVFSSMYTCCALSFEMARLQGDKNITSRLLDNSNYQRAWDVINDFSISLGFPAHYPNSINASMRSFEGHDDSVSNEFNKHNQELRANWLINVAEFCRVNHLRFDTEKCYIRSYYSTAKF